MTSHVQFGVWGELKTLTWSCVGVVNSISVGGVQNHEEPRGGTNAEIRGQGTVVEIDSVEVFRAVYAVQIEKGLRVSSVVKPKRVRLVEGGAVEIWLTGTMFDLDGVRSGTTAIALGFAAC